MKNQLESLKMFLERTTPLGELAQRRRQKRGSIRPTEKRKEEKGSPPLPIPEFKKQKAKEAFFRKFSPYIYRNDYILIWGHGIKYQDQIIDLIRANKNFTITNIQHHRPKTVRRLVRAVYSFDYAPLSHLRAKTRYLMKTPKDVIFIFLKNLKPEEDYFGNGVFRHFESETLKILKEELRDKFNERKDGKRTEDHVIHASDNELQTHFILHYLGLEGLRYFKRKNAIIDVPYHVDKCDEFIIKQVSIESLRCNTYIENQEEITIKESPHYRALAGETSPYQDYLDRLIIKGLNNDYSLERYMKLAKNFEYLKSPYNMQYIATHRLNDGRLLIEDGLHRAAIMCYQGISNLPVAILKRGTQC
jgi:hypothetical protein